MSEVTGKFSLDQLRDMLKGLEGIESEDNTVYVTLAVDSEGLAHLCIEDNDSVGDFIHGEVCIDFESGVDREDPDGESE